MRQTKENGKLIIEKLDMIEEKSRYDSNIIFNKKNKKYGYQLYADRGDVVIVDEGLVEKMVSVYGADARNDCTGITQKFIIYFMALLEKQYNFELCNAGLDPNKASEIEAFINANIRSLDGWPPAVKFIMERSNISYPIMEATKDVRAR